MPKRSKLEERLEALDALRASADSESTLAALRETLASEVAAVVAKAARIAADAELDSLSDDLAAAFARFMAAPGKSDKGCLAKSAIVDALRRLESSDDTVFLAGIRHRQLEPVWGGTTDTACELRSACAAALVEMGYPDILTEVGQLLADAEPSVRAAAAKALAAAEVPAGAALLRLKVLLGDAEPNVTQECFVALLSISPDSSDTFVGQFLEDDDAAVCEAAAFALAQSRTVAAFAALNDWYHREVQAERRRTALTGLALLRREDAFELLFSVVATGSPASARDAIQALSIYRPDDQLRERAIEAVSARADEELQDLVLKSL